MKNFTLLLLFGVVLGAIYLASAQDDDDDMSLFDDMVSNSFPTDSNSAAPSSNKKGDKKDKNKMLKKFMEKFCDNMKDKKDKLAKMKGKGIVKMTENMMAHCEKVKQGNDTKDDNKNFLNNVMQRYKDKSSKGSKGGKEGKGGMKMKEMMKKFKNMIGENNDKS